ncbi:MAG TPA: DUF6084 family protein [Candidatus Sulfotelmatobacter sp.]|nr:DUF6084 family protein [Candidatus Sulfotelmatobacter sp.]
MPDLRFQVENVSATPNSATPQLSFEVRITNAEQQSIHSIALRAQVQVEPVRRRYSDEEKTRLRELFGEPEQWSKSLQPLLWTNANVNVPGFNGDTVVDIPVPCTFDFNVAMTKYIYGLEGGELPTSLLFSGTIFYAGASVSLQVSQIPWDREASYRLPVQVWKEMMDRYYPNAAILSLRRDVFDRLYEFKLQNRIATWDQVFERMLEIVGAKV